MTILSDLSPFIQTYANRMAARHPHLADLADRAADIAENGTIERTATSEWRVVSTSGETYWISQFASGEMLCNCPAFLYRPAVINDRHYCKHIVAQAIYTRAQRDYDECDRFEMDGAAADYRHELAEAVAS